MTFCLKNKNIIFVTKTPNCDIFVAQIYDYDRYLLRICWAHSRTSYDTDLNYKSFNKSSPSVSQTGPTTYDAWKEDMAVVNIFFGQNTLKGETWSR